MMAKFKFRLDSLLRLREMARDERHSGLAEAHRVDQVVAQEQRGLQSDLEGLFRNQREIRKQGHVSVDQLMEGQRYHKELRRRQDQTVEQRKRIAIEIQKRMDAVIAANREVQVLEKLRERLQEKHEYEETRADIKQLDEVGQRLRDRHDDRSSG